MATTKGIRVKKKYGQHFLRDHAIVHKIVTSVELNDQSSVFEIGCGDGFLTQEIVNQPLARLWIFEIDPEWAQYVRENIPDPRITIFEENILDSDLSKMAEHKPWTLLANLPYQITFPILHRLQQNRHLLKEGVIMIQEEVAQKIVKTSGRGYGFPSLFFQHYFSWTLLDKIKPTAFFPPPKVTSRLLHFKTLAEVKPIPDEENFWKFIKICFRQPRRTLRNNLSQSHYGTQPFDDDLLGKRAQQLSMSDLLKVWDLIRI